MADVDRVAARKKLTEVPAVDGKPEDDTTGGNLGDGAQLQRESSRQNTSINDGTSTEKGGVLKVPVNEDFLFDVDIEERELAPAYWLGPIYDVRRGSWFYQESSSLRPCDENLAIQLEEGYLKVKPWRNDSQQPASPRSSPVPTVSEEASKLTEKAREEPSIPTKFELQTQRLFGAYMNSVVTFQDATTAWLLTDDFLSRMSSQVYQRFAGGGHLGGVKVVRGYSEASKPKDAKDIKKDRDQSPRANKSDTTIESPKQRSVPPKMDNDHHRDKSSSDSTPQQEPPLAALERQLSSFSDDPAIQEEEIRQADEQEIKEDYKDEDGQDQSREIEHLILVTHGIGQVSGLNQIPNVANTMRCLEAWPSYGKCQFHPRCKRTSKDSQKCLQ